jgi:hypothetical protein
MIDRATVLESFKIPMELRSLLMLVYSLVTLMRGVIHKDPLLGATNMGSIYSNDHYPGDEFS